MKKKNDDKFLKKFKSDKKYKAKVELIVGFSLIFILLIYSNITGVGNNYNYNNSNTNKDDAKYETDNEENLFDKLRNNYNYECDIQLSKYNESDSTLFDNYNIIYKGTVYNNKEIINKINNGNNINYYKNEDNYYSSDNNELVNIDDIYDMFDYKYININEIKNYVNLGKLDHTTTYSNGNITYVYNVLVRDVISNYNGVDDFNVEIDINNNIVTVSIDYSNLIKESDKLIKELKVNIKYSNINEVSDFSLNSTE